MESVDRKTLAGFRILVAIARADGTVADKELAVLQQSLSGRKDLLDQLLKETIHVDDEIAQLDTPELREHVYRAGFALAHIDEHMAHDEVDILERVWPDHPDDGLIADIYEEVKDTLLPSNIRPVADPALRQGEIDHDVLKYSIIAAIIGATPVPGIAILADAAVVAVQVKMVRDIGQYWGHTIDGKAAKSLLGTAAGGIGMRFAVLGVARFVPGFGAAFAAGVSFATTFALGRVANLYFEGNKGLSEDAMRDLFQKAKVEGQAKYAEQKETIEAIRADHSGEISELRQKVAANEISTAEYERAIVDALDGE